MKIRKIASFFLMLLVAKVNIALATTYECTTEQALVWEHGKFVPDKSEIKTVINFNDETGIFAIAKEADLPFGFSKFNIVHKISQGEDLVAYSMEIINNHLHNQNFYISAWDNSAGLVFMYYARNRVLSGHCKIIGDILPNKIG